MRYQYIRVQAPATLAENYTFDVDLDGETFTVVVPKGGVTEGEEFEVPIPSHRHDNERRRQQQHGDLGIKATISSNSSYDDDDDDDDDDQQIDENNNNNNRIGAISSNHHHHHIDAPHGQFRVSLCSCCDVITQATFWMALCCFPVFLAQILTRLGLKWNGKEIISANKNNNNNHGGSSGGGDDNDNDDDDDDNDNFNDHHHHRGLILRSQLEEENSTFLKIVLTFIGILFLGHLPVVGMMISFLFYLVMAVWIGGNVRRYVRKRWRISKCCSLLPDVLEDRCAMFFCGCCALIQVARHTHDDKDYPGYCCTTTGLEVGAPTILPTYEVCTTTTSTANNNKNNETTRRE